MKKAVKRTKSKSKAKAKSSQDQDQVKACGSEVEDQESDKSQGST